MTELQGLLEGVNLDAYNLFSNKILVGVLFLFLVVATYTDLKSMKIYDKFNVVFIFTRILFALLPVNIAMGTVYGHKFELTHLVGGVMGFLFLLIPAIALMHKMGGDIKFMTILGTFLGSHLTLVFLALSCLYNLVFSLFFIFVLKKGKTDTKLPFAPFFLLAFLTIVIWFVISPYESTYMLIA